MWQMPADGANDRPYTKPPDEKKNSATTTAPHERPKDAPASGTIRTDSASAAPLYINGGIFHGMA